MNNIEQAQKLRRLAAALEIIANKVEANSLVYQSGEMSVTFENKPTRVDICESFENVDFKPNTVTINADLVLKI